MAIFNSYVKLPEGIGGVVEIPMKYLPAITVAGTWSPGSLLWRGLETQARAFADASGVGGRLLQGMTTERVSWVNNFGILFSGWFGKVNHEKAHE